MDDLGARTSYIAVTIGTLVIDSSGAHVGSVSHVLADAQLDVFDGIVVAKLHAPHTHRFADADQVGEIYERGVLLKVAWDQLYEPGENPAALELGADDLVKDDTGAALHERLQRAWSLISGRG
ncbi:MAG TPA: hypothetical protein VFF79_05075 [Conexibacter sp.]|jgi:uncharacterized protein YrrD|nr:hypothetical protein [Conexibacter sp.]